MAWRDPISFLFPAVPALSAIHVSSISATPSISHVIFVFYTITVAQTTKITWENTWLNQHSFLFSRCITFAEMFFLLLCTISTDLLLWLDDLQFLLYSLLMKCSITSYIYPLMSGFSSRVRSASNQVEYRLYWSSTLWTTCLEKPKRAHLRQVLIVHCAK